jgi:hypothetical protein
MGTLNKNANLYTKKGRLVATSEQLQKTGTVFNPQSMNTPPNRKERRRYFARMRK